MLLGPEELERRRARQREYAKAYRAANRKKRAEYNRLWRAANPEKSKAQKARSRAGNQAKRSAYNRRWRAANPEKVKEQKARERENPKYALLRSAASLRWYYKNRERAAAYQRRRNLERASGPWSPGRVQVPADQREHHRELASRLPPSELLRLVNAAVPRLPSRDDREDAVNELALAALDGLVALEDLPRAGKRYADQLFLKLRIRFVQLDACMPGTNRKYHEIIPDNSRSEDD